MALADLETALGRLVRAPDGGDPFRALRLDAGERAWLEALSRSAGFRFTVGVQRSWCLWRAAGAGALTLSILSDATRRELLEAWTSAGGGTSSFVAAEAEAFLDFVACRLPDPSHELTACRLEQATLRAHEGASRFAAPDPASLADPFCLVRRGRHAALVAFHGEPGRMMRALAERAPVSATPEAILLFGPGLAGLCRPASSGEAALWQRLAATARVTVLLGEGHRRDDLARMLRDGVVEYAA